MESIFLLICAFILALMTGVFSRVSNGKTAIGEIVSIERGRFQSSGSTTYYAWIEYEVNEKIYAIKSTNRSSSYSIGDKVKVMYNEKNPEEAVLKPTVYNYIWLTVLIIGAVYFLVTNIV